MVLSLQLCGDFIANRQTPSDSLVTAKNYYGATLKPQLVLKEACSLPKNIQESIHFRTNSAMGRRQGGKHEELETLAARHFIRAVMRRAGRTRRRSLDEA